MGFNLFRKQINTEYDEIYESLDEENKMLVDLYALLILNKEKRMVDSEVTREIVYNPVTEDYKARYIVDVPLKPID